METQNESVGSFAKNYGLVLGLILILIAVIMYVTGLQLEGVQWPMYIYYVIFPAIIIYAISQYKKSNANILSLGQAIKVGLLIAVISALIFAVYGLIFNYLIDPEFQGLAMEATRDKLLENPNLTEELVDQQMVMIEKFSNPLLGSAFWIALSAFFGLIYSLIGGLVMKKEA
ncbi:DUF4199 domain-containing protein [Oceanihabitans sp. 2_MG-2023]|uniref:DUF4199 domain-containing protein n=1 Tax=Oceanihabitans sp. 2_MG-2023 TaxID=3062661 RepID=UPI0026E35759|nr:DUF4199 domain-containing protein [Oceanihabitans sp. 2_MG-2023]MDO6597042.1 DUF4199 domain-containing protein [Oceanihabitans sp. 2_MG-2023]